VAAVSDVLGVLIGLGLCAVCCGTAALIVWLAGDDDLEPRRK
jgi:hypothetical protein